MNIDDFYDVQSLVHARQQLLSDRDLVAEHGRKYLGVTIQGKYQDQELVSAVRTDVLRVIDERVHGLNLKLIDLGVEVSGALLPLPPAAPA